MTDEEQKRDAAQKEKLAQEARAKAEQETFERLTHGKGGEQAEGKQEQAGAVHDHIKREGPSHNVGETPPEAKHGRSPADRAQGRAQEADRAGEKTSPSEMKDWAAKGKEKEEDIAQTKTARQGQENGKTDDETRQQRR